MQEYFKPITYPGIYPNRYMIGNQGHVLDLERYVYVSSRLSGSGYLQSHLLINTTDLSTYKDFLIHRLVAWEWCDSRNIDLEINHIDGCKTNNNYQNLEFVTKSQNLKHAFDNGLRSAKGSNNPKAKLNENQVEQICELLQNTKLSYYGIISKLDLNVSRNTIASIYMRENWSDISLGFDFDHRKRKFND